MNEKERISQLEAEILARKAELQALKNNTHLDFGVYNKFGEGKYGGNSFGLSGKTSNELRSLVLATISLEECVRKDGSVYITTRTKRKISELNSEEILICNNMLKDLYPVIAKYAEIAIKRNRGIKDE